MLLLLLYFVKILHTRIRIVFFLFTVYWKGRLYHIIIIITTTDYLDQYFIDFYLSILFLIRLVLFSYISHYYYYYYYYLARK